MSRDEEFTAFVREASPSLMRTGWLLTGNSDAAADLVQAALVKSYLAWDRIDPTTAMAYTRRAMVNDNIDRPCSPRRVAPGRRGWYAGRSWGWRCWPSPPRRSTRSGSSAGARTTAGRSRTR